MLILFDTMEDLTKEAIDFIRKYEPPEGYFVGFLGGKDSIVTLDLVRRAGVKYEAYYNMTMIDPPEVVAFIRKHYPTVKFLKPEMTFWQGIIKRGLPLCIKRWCCDVLKKNPSKKIPLKHRIMGIRAEESWKRASRPRIDSYKNNNGQIMYKPIFWWSSSDVWTYIKTRNLVYPSLYNEGFARLGCVVCPFLSGQNLKRHKEKWPGYYKVLNRYMLIYWQLNKKKLEKKMDFEDYMKWPEWRGLKKNKNEDSSFFFDKT